MASMQSIVLTFWIKQLRLFGGDDQDLGRMRARFDRLSARSRPHRGVQATLVEVGGVLAEWLAPAGAPDNCVLLYIHGGAWFMGSTNTHRMLVSSLARASGVRALSINYQLAPEHPFPAGLEDCLAAYHWLLRSGISPAKIIVVGDSAGGNLALAMLVALRDAGDPLPAAAVALSPVTDLTFSGESMKNRRHLDPFFGEAGSLNVAEDYLAGQDPRQPLISPLYAELRGLPPLLIHAGDHEVLLDDSLRFGEAAKRAGVDVQVVVWPGMFHVFHAFAPLLPEAKQAIDQIGEFIRERLGEPEKSSGEAS